MVTEPCASDPSFWAAGQFAESSETARLWYDM